MQNTVGILWLVLLSTPPATAGQDAGQINAVRSIVAAEREFASASRVRGTRDAFLAFIADDGILFRPGPVNGREWLLKSRPNPGVLTWEPARAEVARSGDLGYTTGPWELSASAGGKPTSFGQFVTVWQRQPDGTWKFLVDLGIRHAEPRRTQPGLVLSYPKVLGPPGGDPAAARAAVIEADRDLRWTDYAQGAAEDVRAFRMDSFPFEGKAALAAYVAATPGVLACHLTGSGVSRGGDLGYTWGCSEFRAESGAVERGNYLRVWRKGPGELWKVVIDVLAPLPK